MATGFFMKNFTTKSAIIILLIVILRYNNQTMGVTKKELFSAQQNRVAQMAKLLAHPARIAILEFLLKSNTCINGDLVQELGLAQATISQHLRELRENELIQGNIEGVSVCYCINPEKWQEVKDLFNNFFNQYSQPDSSGSCC